MKISREAAIRTKHRLGTAAAFQLTGDADQDTTLGKTPSATSIATTQRVCQTGLNPELYGP
jgi:hypothetical protein